MTSRIVVGDGQGEARIVELKAGRPGPAVFIVPGFGGCTERLAALGGMLRTTMPVLAIEGRGLDGVTQPDTDVRAMAEHYVGRIKARQASGPYVLVGHSFGGLVALEIARRLVRDGEKIDCLIILDSNFTKSLWPRRYYAQVMAARFLLRLQQFKATPARQKLPYLRQMLAILGRNLGLRDVSPGAPCDAMQAHQAAFARYDPGYYAGKLVFFRASLADYPADPEALWRRRVAELDVRMAAGGHLSMLDMPNVISLAADMSACLAEATKAD